jgi:hypothetical protein
MRLEKRPPGNSGLILRRTGLKDWKVIVILRHIVAVGEEKFKKTNCVTVMTILRFFVAAWASFTSIPQGHAVMVSLLFNF